jgi:hypothetical protein
MKLATYCCLLLALVGTTTLAQTHPKKKSARKPVIVRKQETEAPDLEPIQRMCGEIRIPSRSSEATQYVQPDSNKVYTYVEQMPLLDGQHAYLASAAAISHSVAAPANAPAGRVYVQFIVTKEGQASHPHIVKGLRADLDSAVVAATRQLPRFTPGKQGNRVVAVVITVGVMFPVAQ